jgi:hypothetical protein
VKKKREKDGELLAKKREDEEKSVFFIFVP